MYSWLLHFHSMLRYVVLGLLIVSILRSIAGTLKKKHFEATDEKLSLYTLIGVHLQLLIGIGLFFTSPLVKLSNMGVVMKDAVLRFFTVEHSLMMLISIVLITMGRVKSKKADAGWKKHKLVAIFFGIALIIILIAIPWPFSRVPRPWFPGM